MKIALDTNVLVYAEGVNGAGKRDIIVPLLLNLPKHAGIVPVQVLGELFNVLTRKAGESIMVGDNIEITVLSVTGDKVRLGIDAPRNTPVFRREIYDEIQAEHARPGTVEHLQQTAAA